MKNLKKITFVLLSAFPFALYSQDAPEPVNATFEHGTVINNITVTNPLKNSLDVMIQHRFGVMDQPHDLYGVYAPSKIRLYIGYGIMKNLSVGIGARSGKELYDLSWKYNPLSQMTSGMPVTVSYYGNITRCFKLDKDMYSSEGNLKETNRYSYFNQLMISRKFDSHLSLQIAGWYTYYNMIDSSSFNGKHAFYGVSVLGRYKFSPQSSVIFEYDMPLNVSDIHNVATRPMQNIGIGLEVSTGNHQFQIFICNASGILAQEAKVYNNNDFSNTKIPAWLIGFNITRQWGFSK